MANILENIIKLSTSSLKRNILAFTALISMSTTAQELANGTMTFTTQDNQVLDIDVHAQSLFEGTPYEFDFPNVQTGQSLDIVE